MCAEFSENHRKAVGRVATWKKVNHTQTDRHQSLAHTSSTTACHTCCMTSCTGSTSQNVSTTNWESQCIAVCSTRLLSTWSTACCTPVSDIPSRRHLRSATRHHLTVPRYWLSIFGRRAFSVAGPTVWNSLPYQWPSAQQFQTPAENESVSSLILSTDSAVEMLHNSVLYKIYYWHWHWNLHRKLHLLQASSRTNHLHYTGEN